MSARPTPLFLFSLPRSGSTLAQRILAAHQPIATASEPWILLPYLYTLRDRGLYAEYNHSALVRAVEDFCGTLPGGREDYAAEIREFALRLYGRASSEGTRYFLDKTPRYHLISEEIVATFPEGKFLLLWRNPLSVAASIMEKFSDCKWNLYLYKFDLFDVVENLFRNYERNAGAIYTMRYEDLVTQPELSWSGVFRYLDLPFERSALDMFRNVELAGRMGDNSESGNYAGVSNRPVAGWRRTFNNPVRKAWGRRYLRWIGRERLAVMGYDLDDLIAQLDAIPTSYRLVGSDVGRGSWGLIRDLSEPKILKQKLSKLPAWSSIHVHK